MRTRLIVGAVALLVFASCGGREVAPKTEGTHATAPAPAASTSTSTLPTAEPSPPTEGPAPANPLPSNIEPKPRKTISQATTQLSLGDGIQCILLAEGRAACWGPDVKASVEQRSAVELENMRDLSSISVNERGVCGVNAKGKVTCVTTDPRGVLSPLAGLTGIAEIRGTCARSEAGDVTCVDGKDRLAMKSIKGAKALFPFDEGACALAGGAAVCLSRTSAKEKDAASPRAKPVQIDNATEMAVVRGFFCAHTKDGKVICRDPWGYDPVIELEPLRGTTHLAMTRGTACGVDAKGGVVCAGFGQSQDDRPNQAGLAAFPVSGVSDTRALALAKASGCALEGDGHVACFPLRPTGGKLIGEGLVGVDKATCRSFPEAAVCWTKDDSTLPSAASTLEARRIEGVHDIVELASNGRSYCARRKDGQVLCFASPFRAERPGRSEADGALERWDAIKTRAEPSRINGLEAKTIAVGAHHACALRKDGRVACWGDGRYGQLGDGTLQSRVRPAVVPGLKDVQSIVANEDRTCAQRKDGEVRCFGAMSNIKWNAVPIPLDGAPKSATASLSFQGHNLCILDKGAAKCTYFGDAAPFTSDLRAPAPIEAIGHDASFVVARLGDGRLFGWEEGRQFGDGVDLLQPTERLYAGSNLVRINGKDDWLSVGYKGEFNSKNTKLGHRPAEGLGEVVFVEPSYEPCIVRKGGEVACQTEAGAYARVKVPPSTEVRIGSGFWCALHEDGGVSCWGETAFGQLGNGIESTSPEAYFVAGLP